MIALFIDSTDLKQFSVIDGSVDDDKIKGFIKISQQIHIQNFLGTKLYERLQEGIINDDLNADEDLLIKDYVKDALIHYAAIDFIEMSSLTIANGGAFKHSSENSETATDSEVQRRVKKHEGYANYYTKRLIDYLCNNNEKYPEFSQNTREDIYPDRRVKAGSWYNIKGRQGDEFRKFWGYANE